MNEVRRVQVRQQLEYRHGVDTAATPKVVGKPAVAADTPDQSEPSTVTPFPAYARPRVRANNPPNNPEKMRMVIISCLKHMLTLSIESCFFYLSVIHLCSTFQNLRLVRKNAVQPRSYAVVKFGGC